MSRSFRTVQLGIPLFLLLVILICVAAATSSPPPNPRSPHTGNALTNLMAVQTKLARLASVAHSFQEKRRAVQSGQRFKPLDRSSDPYCSSDAVIAEIGQLFISCLAGTESLNAELVSLPEANAAMASFCESTCGSQLNGLDSRVAACVPPELKDFVDSTGFLCSRDGPNYCGAVVIVAGEMSNCGSQPTAVQCQSRKTQCEWNDVASQCQTRVTTQQLDSVCGRCLTEFATNHPNGGSFGPEAVDFVSLMLNTLCYKIPSEAAYCYPLVQSHLQGADRIATNGMPRASLERLCDNSFERQCFTRMARFAASSTMLQDTRAFRSCVSRNVGSSWQQRQCLSTYEFGVFSDRRTVDALNSLCLGEASGSETTFCLEEPPSSSTAPVRAGCLSDVEKTLTCNSTCDVELKSFVNARGCCMGSIHKARYGLDEPLSADEIPIVTNSDGKEVFLSSEVLESRTPSPATTTDPRLNLGAAEPSTPKEDEVLIASPPAGGFEYFGACPSMQQSIRTTLTIGCSPFAGVSLPKLKRSLSLNIAFNVITASPKLRTKLFAALTADVASLLGTSPSSISEAELSADSTKSVEVASSRRQSSPGTRFEFTATVGDVQYTNAVAAAFDADVKAGSVYLPQTKDFVDNGCNCRSSTQQALTVTARASVVGVLMPFVIAAFWFAIV